MAVLKQKLAQECAGLGYQGKLIAHKCDVSNEAEIDETFKWIEANHGGVDVCVNNAGFATKEPLLGKILFYDSNM